MIVRILLLVVVILSVSLANATQPENFGRPLPQSSGNEAARVGMPDGTSVALDDLPSKAITGTLERVMRIPETPTLRGRKEIDLYRNTALAVVLVITKDGGGSGIHIGDGRIITNWHVVGASKVVDVLFKPQVEGANLNRAAVIRANVVKTDSISDLALLQAASVPSSAKVMDLGSETEIQIGADVHAIGHPTGETWTYTKGIISQIRLNYEWNAKGIELSGQRHPDTDTH